MEKWNENDEGLIKVTIEDIRACRDQLPFQAGDTVTCTVDWSRRFDFMQQHSAQVSFLNSNILCRYTYLIIFLAFI